MATKRLIKSRTGKYRLWIFATVITLASLLGYLETQGISTSHSGDMVCGGSTVCEGYFNISIPSKVSNYLGQSINITELCFGKDLKVVINEPEKVNNLAFFKADKRYRVDNPNRWKPFNFTGVCLPIGDYEFKINATKSVFSHVKWGVDGTNIDPDWKSIEIDYFDYFILKKIDKTTWEANVKMNSDFFTDALQCRDIGTLAQKAECFRDFCNATVAKGITTTSTKNISSIVFSKAEGSLTIRFTTPSEILPKDIYNEIPYSPKDDRAKAALLSKLICRWLP